MRLLAPVSKLYELGLLVRAVTYGTGYRSISRLDQPVISVGNVTLGGTGKTPIVAHIAGYLRDQGYETAVLTRGYGRRHRERYVLRNETGMLPDDAVERGGDEPVLLAREVHGVSIIVDANRTEAARWASKTHSTDVFLLDDGYQHLKLARDLNLLILDGTDPFGGLRMPPFGRLREPLQALQRADAVIVTRSDRAIDEATIERVVRGTCRPDVPIFHAWHDIESLRPIHGGSEQSPQSLRARKVGVVTAIGNPAVFVEDLQNIGIEVVSESLWRDHHAYSRADYESAVQSALAAGAEALLTTEKDAVKLERLGNVDLPVLAVRIGFRSNDEGQLLSLVMKAILGRQP